MAAELNECCAPHELAELEPSDAGIVLERAIDVHDGFADETLFWELLPLTPALTSAFCAVLSLHKPELQGAENSRELPPVRKLVLSDEERAHFDKLASLPSAARHSLLRSLASHKGVDSVWHLMAACSQQFPEDLELIEDLLASWSDHSCRMPHVWEEAIRSGQSASYHQLVRVLGVNEDEVSLLWSSAGSESLAGLRALGLSCVDEVSVRRVFGLRWLQHVRELHLIDTPAVAESTALVGVEQLEVRGRQQARDLANLITSSSFPALAELHLFGVGATLGELAQALGERRLTRSPFALRLTSLPMEGLEAFVAQPAVRGLSGLDFIGMEFGLEQVRTLAAAELTLQRLMLHQGSSGPEGAAALCAAEWLPQIRDLSLPAQQFGDSAAAAILRGLVPTALTLRHNQLGPETAAVLAEADLSQLVSLELSHNPLSDAELGRILSNPTLTHLQRLNVVRTGAGVETMRAVARSRR